MKNFWKWALGILLVLVVIAALVGASYWMRTGAVGRIGMWDYHFDRGFYSPMMNVHGISPFGGSLMFFGMGLARLLPLFLLGALVYGAYRYGKRSMPPAVQPAAPAPVRSCPKCGYAVQDGWNNCANCGRKL
ncbi:MAG: zinc ribbon domain-containing protein [Chloroflexi bacterium]|nr:zinc ribbon domain-containing protein [Chloroflexota bacterium]